MNAVPAMHAPRYKSSAALAVFVHALAAVAIGFWAARSLSSVVRMEQPATIRVDLAPDPSPAPAEPASAPRTVELPRLQRQPEERAAADTPRPAPALPEIVVAASVAPSTPAPGFRLAPPATTAKKNFQPTLAARADEAGDIPKEAPNPGVGAPAAGNTADFSAVPSPRVEIRPLYPLGARRRGESGQVVLDARVEANGRVAQVSVCSSSGYADLDQAAERAVRRAPFRPAIRGGRPVDARVRITVQFQLTD